MTLAEQLNSLYAALLSFTNSNPTYYLDIILVTPNSDDYTVSRNCGDNTAIRYGFAYSGHFPTQIHFMGLDGRIEMLTVSASASTFTFFSPSGNTYVDMSSTSKTSGAAKAVVDVYVKL